MSKLKKTFIILIIIGSILSVGFFYLSFVYYPQQLEIKNTVTETLDFEVETGESISSISKHLANLKVINSEWVFENYLKKNNLDTKVEAGFFKFAPGITIPEVAETLQKSRAQQITFTAIEGWNSAEIDQALAEKNLIKSGEFKSSIVKGEIEEDWMGERPNSNLEGYLFPATYYLDPNNFSVADLTQKMLKAMQKNLEKAGYDPENTKRNLHEILTMASIIQLEEKDSDSQPLVADILWRRLDAGWPLGADATLFYILGHRNNLTAENLTTDSPYNTRKNRGLPPTPICAPGLSALKAAIQPESNDYWYYLHDSKTGEIHFTKTLDEHNENKARYIQ